MLSPVDQLEEKLTYRLPQSGKQLGTIVMSRAEAQDLLNYIYKLQKELALVNK